MAELPVWEWFIDAVEGRPGATPIIIKDGLPTFAVSSDAVEVFGHTVRLLNPPIGKPDIEPVVDLLRSPEPIPALIGAWLADLLEAGPSRALALELTGRQRGAPDIGHLVARLRSLAPLSSDERAAFADLLSPRLNSYHRLILKRRRLGAPPKRGVANWQAAELVNRLVEKGEPEDAAVSAAASAFGLGASTVRSARSEYRAALARHEENRRSEWATED